MDMPRIDGCEVGKCSYNRDGECHALAITVGGSAGALCDTFVGSEEEGGDPGAIGSVGACKMSQCAYNRSLECTAGAIHVAGKGHDADCVTFEPT